MSERTIAFVDLAGVTALTEVHSDSVAIEIVKTVGDSVMLAAPDPATGVAAVRRLGRSARRRVIEQMALERMPPLP